MSSNHDICDIIMNIAEMFKLETYNRPMEQPNQTEPKRIVAKIFYDSNSKTLLFAHMNQFFLSSSYPTQFCQLHPDRHMKKNIHWMWNVNWKVKIHFHFCFIFIFFFFENIIDALNWHYKIMGVARCTLLSGFCSLCLSFWCWCKSLTHLHLNDYYNISIVFLLLSSLSTSISCEHLNVSSSICATHRA